MRFPNPAKTAVCAILALVVLSPTVSIAAEPDHLRRVTPALPGAPEDKPQRSADETLTAVQAGFGDIRGSSRGTQLAAPDGTHLTLLLRDLQVQLRDLPPGDRRRARGYLARPTHGDEPFGATYRKARATHDCKVSRTKGSHFCVHWARRTRNAPPLADKDKDGLPNQVERTRNVLNKVWKRVVVRGGYRRPPKDRRGPNNRFDVYLADTGQYGVYGYCVPERTVGKRRATSYCVLDDDFSKRQFPANGPKKNLVVTAAHEFFHAVQFSHDALEDVYFMENTATWIEDEVFDHVNDNRQYLWSSSQWTPGLPLDDVGFRYGNWIWWRFLSERFPDTAGTNLPLLLRDVWRRSRRWTSMQALEQALQARGAELATLAGEFAVANRNPAQHYDEGAHYPTAELLRTHSLTAAQRAVSTRSFRLPHLSSQTVAFVPASGHREGSRLSVGVRLPAASRDPRAHVTVFPVTGTPTTTPVRVVGTGVGSVSVPFTTEAVRRVELTLTNGGHDDGLTFEYSASTTSPSPTTALGGSVS